jgi:hypothetical protein
LDFTGSLQGIEYYLDFPDSEPAGVLEHDFGIVVRIKQPIADVAKTTLSFYQLSASCLVMALFSDRLYPLNPFFVLCAPPLERSN